MGNTVSHLWPDSPAQETRLDVKQIDKRLTLPSGLSPALPDISNLQLDDGDTTVTTARGTEWGRNQISANQTSNAVSSVLPAVTDVQVNGGTMNVVGGNMTNVFVTVNTIAGDSSSPTAIARVRERLSLGEFPTIQQETYRRRIKNTGLWILQLDKFKAWVEIRGKVFWATGMPGAGKTHLASVVVDHLRKLAAKNINVSVAFAYFRHSNPMDVLKVLESLVRQLAESSTAAAEMVAATLARLDAEGETPSEDDYVDLLKALSKECNACFFILDGLDEAPRDVQFNIIDLLSSIDANICIFSRPLKLMQLELTDLRRDITFADLVAQDQDIELLVQEKIRTTPELRVLLAGNDEVKADMIRKIKRNAGGMFLHAYLQIEDLRHSLSVSEILAKLEAFPTNLYGMYITTMNRIEQDQGNRPKIAKRALVWILYVETWEKGFTIEDLQQALATSPEAQTFDDQHIVQQTSILSICCGLVTIDSKNRPRLMHFTAVDALKSLLLPAYPNPHAMISATCTAYLIHRGFPTCQLGVNDVHNALEADSFLGYTHHFLRIHLQRAVDAEPSFNSDFVTAFLSQCRTFPFRDDFCSMDYSLSLHVAVWLGVPHIVLQVLTADPSLLNTTSVHWGRTAVMIAALLGRIKILELLLDYPGVDPHIADDSGVTALMHAIAGPNKAACCAQLLRCNDIDVNARDDSGRTALMYASERGCTEIVSSLLAFEDIDINAKDERSNWTALLYAADTRVRGHDTSTAAALLGHSKIDVNATDNTGATALIRASIMDNADIVQTLLDFEGIDPNIADNTGQTALQYAYNRKLPTVAKKLLAFPGIQGDVVTRAILESTDVTPGMVAQLSLLGKYELIDAMIFACSSGNDVTVRALLKVPDIQVNATYGREEATALIRAAGEGQEKVVQVLLADPRIDINIGGHYTALAAASRAGHEGVVKMILGHPGVHSQVGVNTAFMMASQEGQLGVVPILLGYPDIDINFKNYQGYTPLDISCRNGYKAIEALLREQPGAQHSELYISEN